MPSQAVLLGSMTIPGEAAQLHAARQFVTQTLGDDHSCADTAVLLTSELVTNSVQHSYSRRPGGTVTITVITVPGSVRVEVIDGGGATVPVVRMDLLDSEELTEDGRGLHLVELIATRWGHYSDDAGTVTWFELTTPSEA
jgi:anti-sigma regulatory factor (Ser/Thr protein kinase)